MAGDRKSRLLRIPPELDKALERAAAKDMRPVSVLIERILRQAMIRSGDLRDPAERTTPASDDRTNTGVDGKAPEPEGTRE